MPKPKRPKLPRLEVECDHPGTGEYWCKKGTCAFRAAQTLLDEKIALEYKVQELEKKLAARSNG